MEGFIKLHRQITQNEFWLSERFTKSQAWIDLLLLATYKERTVFIRGIEINLQSGELCYAKTTLAKRWGWNERTVNRYLKALEKREMIQSRITNITTIISILNWKEYQINTEQSAEQNTEQSKSRIQTNKKVKKVKNNNADSFSIKFLPENLNGELFSKTKYFFITMAFKDELLEKFSNKGLSDDSLKNEFYKMEAWLDDNRPKKSYKRFIINWIGNMRIQPNNEINKTKEIAFREA